MRLEDLLVIASQLSVIKTEYTIYIGPNNTYILKTD